ncbi:MAG: PilZ domain-containing protein [Sphingopyxis sp.]
MPPETHRHRVGAVARQIAPGRDHAAARIERRYKTFAPAMVRTSSGPMRVHILDVSRAGVRLHGAIAPGIGDIIHVAFDDDHVAARVRWTKGGMFGAEFCPPLYPSAVTRILSLLGIQGLPEVRR